MKKFTFAVTTVVMTVLMAMTSNAATLSCKITNTAVTSSAGRSLYVIGDSYSTFDVEGTRSNEFYYPFNKTDNNNVNSLNDTWREKLAKKAGLSIAGVDAYSGSSITDRTGDDKPSMVERIEASPRKNADIIILMGGLNDAWQHVEIGSTDQSTDYAQFAPALRYSLRMLKENNPNSKLIYSLIVYDNDVKAYEEAAHKICEEECITFVPIYGAEISCEGWHPTVSGMETIANKLLPYVNVATTLSVNDNTIISAATCAAKISGI